MFEPAGAAQRFRPSFIDLNAVYLRVRLLHMQDEQLEDLKQFIGATVSQSEERLRAEISRVEGKVDGLEGRVDGLRQEMLDGFSGVGEAIDELHKEIEERASVTDQRLTKLEQRAA